MITLFEIHSQHHQRNNDHHHLIIKSKNLLIAMNDKDIDNAPY